MNISKVSVITVCYNASDVISQCLDSVEEQAVENVTVEHIVIDGGSNDGTVEIVRGHHNPDHVVSEKDDGLYDAMNKGLEKATGDVIAFLNSDDVYANPNVISDVVSAFKTSHTQAVFGDLVVFDPKQEGHIVRRWKAGPQGDFKHGWMPPHPTLFVRTSVFDRHGGFNLKFKFAADYEWMIRSLYTENLALTYLPKTLVKMSAGGLSNASLRNRLKAHLEDYSAWKVNGKTPYPWTVFLKPLRKITQFIK